MSFITRSSCSPSSSTRESTIAVIVNELLKSPPVHDAAANTTGVVDREMSAAENNYRIMLLKINNTYVYTYSCEVKKAVTCRSS